MQRPLKTLFWLIIFLSAPFWVIADDLHEGWLHNVSKENGLSGETVSQIITGPDGQMWLATNDGVCRYNGREITAFAMPRQGYEPNYTHALTFAPDRSLYAATDEGLFRLRRGSSTFQRVYPMLDKVERFWRSVRRSMPVTGRDFRCYATGRYALSPSALPPWASRTACATFA